MKKRVMSENSVVGCYVVLKDKYQQGDFHTDFVQAEEAAAKLSHDNPGQHVIVAQVGLQLLATTHVTVNEVLPK